MSARVDRRTRAARLHSKLMKEFTSDISSDGKLSKAQQILASQAALISLRCTELEEQVLSNEATENLDDTLVRLSNAATRIFRALGIEARKKQRDLVAESWEAAQE